MPDSPAKFDTLVTRVRASRLPSPTMRRQIRESAEVTIREAAEALGVSSMTYLRWEKGAAQPSREHAIDYRAFLDALRAAAA